MLVSWYLAILAQVGARIAPICRWLWNVNMWHYNAIVRVFSSISPSKKSFVCGDVSLPVPDEGVRVCYVTT